MRTSPPRHLPAPLPFPSRAQEILDQWLKCQGKWQYLEPIFGAEEIMKQIPREGQAFRDMDNTWRRIMDKVRCVCVCGGGGGGSRLDGRGGAGFGARPRASADLQARAVW